MILFCFHEKTHSVQNLSICNMHTANRFLHLLMAAAVTFCCRLPDVNKVLLQIINTMKFTPVLPRLKIA